MDMLTIIYIAIAAIAGLLIGKLLLAPKKINSSSASNDSLENLEKHEKQIIQAQNELAISEQKAKDLRSKYETLLDEAKKANKDLSKQLAEKHTGIPTNGISDQQLADIDKLKKKIKDLEEENEDFEDDINSYKNKLKTQNETTSLLQIDFDKVIREKKQLQEDLNTLSHELQTKVKELELKMESLSFVQEMLTAQRSSEADINEYYCKVDSLCEFIRGELKDNICNLYNLNKDTLNYFFGSGLDTWAITAKKSWIQGKTSIAFVGEFSAGKTSIVNRILSQDNPNIPLLPVSTKATTAIPTYISGGVGTMYQFVTPNNELKNILESTFKKVNKEVLDQVKGVSSLIQYFVMTYKNTNLNKLSILDTPGFNSNDKEDAERTISVINECDALFWVFDVNAGTVNRASINLIKQHLAKPLFVVINKVDTKAKSEVDKVEALIRKTLSDAGQTIQGVIRFSSKAPLTDIMGPINSIKYNQEKDSYIKNVGDAIKAWTAEQEKDVINAKKSADKLRSSSENITNQYNRAIKNMGDDCVEAAEIPQFKEHLFKKDNYEISQSDYQRLCNILSRVCNNHCDTLCNLYNKMSEVSSELESTWKNYSDEKEKWQELNNCLNIFNKKVKELKE